MRKAGRRGGELDLVSQTEDLSGQYTEEEDYYSADEEGEEE